MWTPPDTRTPLTAFTETVAERHGLAGTDYETLRAFSVTSTALFWSSVWDFCQIIHSAPYTSVIDETLSIDTVPRWFAGARLNYCENLLRPEFTGLALISAGESQNYGQLTHQQLAMRVGQCARALQHAGIITGDRVAAYVPNCIESVIFFLATVSLGAIWSSTSPDFGVAGVLDRFRQIEPKLLVSVNAVTYNGKDHDHSQKLKLVVQGLPSLTRVVVFSLLEPITDVSDIPNAVTCRQFLQAFPLELPVCAQLPFDHPLVIVFSSGTTGKPKCIVHSHGGALIQHLKEHVLHGGMGPEDVFFYYTTTGWMMWNWLVSGLATGATIVLYDGSPFKPSPARLFELVDEFKITHFGTSAKYIQALEDAHFHPAKHFSLSSLKMIYSTGSPLKPESFDFVFNHIKRNVCLGSITGGTDIISLFAGHNISSPVHRGEIQCRSLGMSIEAWDDSGKPVMDQPGDLVCTSITY